MKPSRKYAGKGPRISTGSQIDYSNVVALGEFLLGYPNEYNKYTDRPLIDPDPVNGS